MSGGDRRAERAGRAWRVKAARLVGVPGSAPDPDHHLVAGDKGGDQVASARAKLLGDRESGRQYGGAGMSAGARAGQAVELERMGERPVGECGGVRLHGAATAAENMALAAGPGALGVAHHDPAPRQGAAADDRRHRVGNAVLGSPHDFGGQILIPQSGGVFGEPDGFLCHDCRPRG